MFRFIVHDYSIPLDFPASRKVVHNRARHDLDAFVWNLDDSVRSHCPQDRVFKKLPFSRYAMGMILPHDCELLTGEFAEREKLWSSYCHGKKVDWSVSIESEERGLV